MQFFLGVKELSEDKYMKLGLSGEEKRCLILVDDPNLEIITLIRPYLITISVWRISIIVLSFKPRQRQRYGRVI